MAKLQAAGSAGTSRDVAWPSGYVRHRGSHTPNDDSLPFLSHSSATLAASSRHKTYRDSISDSWPPIINCCLPRRPLSRWANWNTPSGPSRPRKALAPLTATKRSSSIPSREIVTVVSGSPSRPRRTNPTSAPVRAVFSTGGWPQRLISIFTCRSLITVGPTPTPSPECRLQRVLWA